MNFKQAFKEHFHPTFTDIACFIAAFTIVGMVGVLLEIL
jgi:hypothetical protein